MRPSGASLGAGEQKNEGCKNGPGIATILWGWGELFKCQMMMSVESLLANHDF